MKILVKYLKDYKLECVMAPLLKALEALFELMVPLVIADMIDNSLPLGRIDSILSKGSVLLILALLGITASVLAQYSAAKAAIGLSENLRHDLFAHIMGYSFSEIDQFSQSTMINRLTADVNSVQTGVNMILRLFLRSPFIVIGATVMASLIDVKASLIFISLIAILAIIVYFLVYKNIPLLKNVQNIMDSLNAHIRANLFGTRVIRAFVREEQERDEFKERNDSVLSAQIISGRISALLNPLTYLVINIFIVILIRFGAIEVRSGYLSTGQVVALYNYMSQILVELVKFANFLITINKAFASAGRINELFKVASPMVSSAGDQQYFSDAYISFKNVSLKYHGLADEALSDIDIDIEKGETVGIIGSTGSGKTSLANVLMGFYPVSKGAVLFDGKNINKYDAKIIKDKIAIVMQKAVLFKGTIADNLRWGKKTATTKEMEEALETACCLDTVNSLGGLKTEILSGGSNLSGGQRQRLSIARALIKEPEVLILDDSSSALDYLTETKLKNNLRNLSFKPTILIISQRISSIKDLDKIIVLDDGKVSGIGSHDQLMGSCSVYKEIYNSQV